MNTREPERGDEVSLREITAETVNAVLALRVAESQRKMVAENARSIAQAHFSPYAWFRAVYAAEVPVGFVQLYLDAEKEEYEVWRFMIDARYQRLGFGRRALELAIEHVRSTTTARELLLGVAQEEGHAQPFYARFGFEPTGEIHEGEVIMRLVL